MRTRYDFSAYGPSEQRQRVTLRNLPTAIRGVYKPGTSTARVVANETLLIAIVWVFLAILVAALEKAYLVSSWSAYLLVLMLAMFLIGLWHWWDSDEVDRAKLFAQRNQLVLVSEDFRFVIACDPFIQKTGKYELFLANAPVDFTFFVATYCHWRHRPVQDDIRDYVIIGKKAAPSKLAADTLGKGWQLLTQDGFVIAYKKKSFDHQSEAVMRGALRVLELL